jgi:hypothetical protein
MPGLIYFATAKTGNLKGTAIMGGMSIDNNSLRYSYGVELNSCTQEAMVIMLYNREGFILNKFLVNYLVV